MNFQPIFSFLEAAEKAGWSISLKRDGTLALSEEFGTRYPDLPQEYAEFLRDVKACHNGADTSWFLCEDDYNGATDSAFAWNEFEKQSLDAAEEDAELISAIEAFWESHLPIMISVKNGYAFLALCVKGENRGGVIAGREPEYEEVEKVCETFAALLETLTANLLKSRSDQYLSNFI